MKFLLLNSCFYKSKRRDYIEQIKPHLRVGIASIASLLKKASIPVIIEDPQIMNLDLHSIVKKILLSKADAVCFPAYTEEIGYASEIAKSIKKSNRNIFTLIGGPHISAFPIKTLNEFGSFDIGVIGEGEKTILEIAEGKDIENIKGIVYKKNGRIYLNPERNNFISLNDLAFPAWDLYDLDKYSHPLPVEPLRGCPFSCTFCFRTTGQNVRYKKPRRIVDEINWNIQNYNKKSITFNTGTFPLNRSHAFEVCEEIIKRKLKIDWQASTRVDTIDFDLLKIMKYSGCKRLQIGAESGDSEILKQCGKNINPQMIIKILKICKMVGIKTGANFILGLPYETKETILKTYKLALKIRKYVESVNFAILTPFPGTRVYEMALKNEGGLRLKSSDWSDYGKQIGQSLEHVNFQNGELSRYQTKFYLSWYLRSPAKMVKFFSWKRIFQLIKQVLSQK